MRQILTNTRLLAVLLLFAFQSISLREVNGSSQIVNNNCDGDLLDIQRFDCSNRGFTNMSEIGNLEMVATSLFLNISFNKFEKLTDFMRVPKYVLELNFSSNLIESVERFAFYMNQSDQRPITVLSSLDLSRNRIANLPLRSLLDMKSLQTLHLSHNPLASFDKGDLAEFSNDELRGRIHVRELYANNCQVESVDASVIDLFHALTVLDLSANLIRHIQPSFGLILNNKFHESFHLLHLYENPLECDCHLAWLREFYTNRSYKRATYCSFNESLTAVQESQNVNEHYLLENFSYIKKGMPS
jgi:hypothetical protein